MTLHRFTNWLLAFAICAMLCTSYLLDGPTDHQAAQAQASSLQDAQKAAKSEQHLANARKAAGVAL
jgi:hypothetical protein